MGPPPPNTAASELAPTRAPEESWRPRPGKLIGDVIVEQGFAPREAVESAAVAGREPDELLRAADAAMYQAKSRGGGAIARAT